MRISTRIQSLLVSAALLVPLVATPVTAATRSRPRKKTAASWSGVVINEAYLSGGSKAPHTRTNSSNCTTPPTMT